MHTAGRHCLIEFFGCSQSSLNDAEQLTRSLRAAAEAAGARVVGEVVHSFSPHGVTALVLLEESHLSIHTWPETGYAAVDFYSCGDVRTVAAVELLAERLSASQLVSLEIQRGGGPDTTLGGASRTARSFR